MSTARVNVGALLATAALCVGVTANLAAQEITTRAQEIEQAQREKSQQVRPMEPGKFEGGVARIQQMLTGTGLKWHPFFQNAYSGGGFTLGAGYGHFVSPYNTIDARGSYTILGYKRLEAEFEAPRLFKRRGKLSILGGWREATQVGFYGLGTGTTSIDDRANYSFRQPYLSANLAWRPTLKLLTLEGGLEYTKWEQRPGEGSFPSVETVYTPDTLAGLGAAPTYLHSQGTFGFDWRTSPGYSRRGGFYGVTLHDYADRDDRYGFRQVDYEAIQHVPIFREAWALSFRALARTTQLKDGEDIPFFMLPAVGGGSSLRGFSSWRFRDRHSLLLQAEWRIMVNRFMDTAVFYDTGKVSAHVEDLDLNGLKNDFGFGVRFHGPFFTPLRVELAKSNEGLSVHLLVVSGVLRRVCDEDRFVVCRLFVAAPVWRRGDRCVRRDRRGLDAASALLSRRPHRTRSRIARRRQCQALRDRTDVRDVLQPVRRAEAEAVE